MFKYLLIALVALSIFQTDGFAQEADCPPHQSGAQPVSLISGFDDVLRQARNQGMLPSVEQFFHPDYTFAGMRELYSELTAAEPGPVKFNLLSGFPSWGKHRVAKFLSGAQFPKSRLTLRNWFLDRSLGDFKVGNASRIMSDRPDRPFIVVFDNSPPSYVMAHRLLGLFPRQLTGFYLHEVVHRDESPMQGTELYLTAYDIAQKEWLKGHLSSKQATRVAQAIVDKSNSEYVIPGYAYCPRDYHPCGEVLVDNPQARICHRLEDKIAAICAAR